MTTVEDLPATSTPAELLQWLDPKILAAHPANIRRSVGDLTGLKASIDQLGILEPIVARWAGDGGYIVVAGHRRLAAALELDQALVPVRVIDFGTRSDIAAMAAENLQRLDLTAGEEAATYVQLQADGLDVEAIVAQTGMARARVERGLQVAGSKAASKAATKLRALTLDQAATFVEFEGNDDALADLTSTVRNDPGQFDHVAEKLRQAARSAELYAAAVDKAKADGLTVVEKPPGYMASGKNCPVTYLSGGMTVDKHRNSCEGHAVSIVRGHPEPQIVAVCTTPSKFHPRPGDKPTAKPTADERAKAEQEAAELAERAAAWDAATVVRRAHAKKLLERKTPAKGALRFAIERIALNPYIPGEGDDDSVYNDLVGTEDAPARLKRCQKAPDQLLPVVLLGLVIAGVEKDMEAHLQPWAEPKRHWVDGRPTMAAYLAWLATTGYTLAPVEELILPPKATPKPAAKKVAKAAAKKPAAK